MDVAVSFSFSASSASTSGIAVCSDVSASWKELKESAVGLEWSDRNLACVWKKKKLKTDLCYSCLDVNAYNF